MIIHVTQIDIDKAVRHREYGQPYRAYCDCPIAQALQREHGTWRVRVDGAYVSITLEGIERRYHSSQVLNKFMERFDAGRTATPRTFRVKRELSML